MKSPGLHRYRTFPGDGIFGGLHCDRISSSHTERKPSRQAYRSRNDHLGKRQSYRILWPQVSSHSPICPIGTHSDRCAPPGLTIPLWDGAPTEDRHCPRTDRKVSLRKTSRGAEAHRPGLQSPSLLALHPWASAPRQEARMSSPPALVGSMV